MSALFSNCHQKTTCSITLFQLQKCEPYFWVHTLWLEFCLATINKRQYDKINVLDQLQYFKASVIHWTSIREMYSFYSFLQYFHKITVNILQIIFWKFHVSYLQFLCSYTSLKFILPSSAFFNTVNIVNPVVFESKFKEQSKSYIHPTVCTSHKLKV